MEHISRAWTVVSRDLVQWILVFVVAACVSLLTCGVGLLLVGPNLMLVARRAVDRGGPPEVGDLFQMELLVEYVIYWVVTIVLSSVSNVLPGIGPFLVATLLFWTLPLIVDRRFGAVEALQASFHHVKGAFFDVLVFTLVLYVLWLIGGCACFVGVFVAGPVGVVATILYYDAEKDKILGAASAAGLTPIR